MKRKIQKKNVKQENSKKIVTNYKTLETKSTRNNGYGFFIEDYLFFPRIHQK